MDQSTLRRLKSNQIKKQKIPPLDKKIKPNPKYENIRSSIDTGNNTRKQLERTEEIKTYYKFRPDEIFRRINVTSLTTLMIGKGNKKVFSNHQIPLRSIFKNLVKRQQDF